MLKTLQALVDAIPSTKYANAVGDVCQQISLGGFTHQLVVTKVKVGNVAGTEALRQAVEGITEVVVEVEVAVTVQWKVYVMSETGPAWVDSGKPVSASLPMWIRAYTADGAFESGLATYDNSRFFVWTDAHLVPSPSSPSVDFKPVITA